VAFDPGRLEIQGTPLPVLEDVASSSYWGGGQFDFSGAGSFVYLEGKQAAQTWPVMWLERSGNMQPLGATAGAYSRPPFSPDGRQLALVISTNSGNDIFSYDWQRETMTRLTFSGNAAPAIWAPDGGHIVFRTFSTDVGLWWMRSDGSGEPQRLLTTQNTL